MNRGIKMKIITINIQEEMIKKLDSLIGKLFCSRSEAIRYLIHTGMVRISEEEKMIKDLDIPELDIPDGYKLIKIRKTEPIPKPIGKIKPIKPNPRFKRGRNKEPEKRELFMINHKTKYEKIVNIDHSKDSTVVINGITLSVRPTK